MSVRGFLPVSGWFLARLSWIYSGAGFILAEVWLSETSSYIAQWAFYLYVIHHCSIFSGWRVITDYKPCFNYLCLKSTLYIPIWKTSILGQGWIKHCSWVQLRGFVFPNHCQSKTCWSRVGRNEALQRSLHKQGARFGKAWQQKGYKMILLISC